LATTGRRGGRAGGTALGGQLAKCPVIGGYQRVCAGQGLPQAELRTVLWRQVAVGGVRAVSAQAFAALGVFRYNSGFVTLRMNGCHAGSVESRGFGSGDGSRRRLVSRPGVASRYRYSAMHFVTVGLAWLVRGPRSRRGRRGRRSPRSRPSVRTRVTRRPGSMSVPLRPPRCCTR
jgi:hypothetical protein